jgi:hypothetical protein
MPHWLAHLVFSLLLGWLVVAVTPVTARAAGSPCLSPGDLPNADEDVARNHAALADMALCIEQDRFDEGGLHWSLLIIRNAARPDDVLWVVPHNNEHDAFDSALHGVRGYGGTVVAVRTGGTRNNGHQDPNRNFDSGSPKQCPRQTARSPLYTDHVMRWRVGHAPIIALHTNERGYDGDGHGGSGTISIARPPQGTLALRATAPPVGQSPDDTMIFVASRSPPGGDPKLSDITDRLRGDGINIAWERVTTDGEDCSLSNYANSEGIRNYFNIEVVRGDGGTQRRIIDILIESIPVDWR